MSTKRLRFEAPHYILRAMETSDAERDWGGWLVDADTAAILNAAPKALSLEERRAYIANFDGENAYLFGIFERATDRLVGIWNAYTDLAHLEVFLNTLIGAREMRFLGAVTQTRDLLYAYFFNELGFTSARIAVVEKNTHMVQRVQRHGWVHEHTSSKAGPDGRSVTLLHFRLTRDAWLAFLDRQRQGNDRSSAA